MGVRVRLPSAAPTKNPGSPVFARLPGFCFFLKIRLGHYLGIIELFSLVGKLENLPRPDWLQL